MTAIDKIVFSQNAPAKNTLWARPSEKGTELLIFNKGKWGTVGADDFQRFHYEVYSSLEDITEPKPNALYLIGPKGEGEDKYDEYVYTEEGFTKIGDTSIDMSDVIKYSKNSDDSYTLKAEGTEIKKLKTTDDSTIVLGDNNSIEFGASGTINMQSGKVSGVKDIQMTYGKIDNLWDIYGGYNDTHIYMTGNNNINVDGATIDNVGTISGSSGGLDITASGTAGVNINGITIKSGGTLTFGDGTTMSTAATPTNLDDTNNVIGGKALKLYYTDYEGTVQYTAPIYYDKRNRRIQLYVGIAIADHFSGSFSGLLSGSVAGASSIRMLSGLITGVKTIDMQENPSTTINMHNGTINMGAGIIGGAKDITFDHTGTISGNNTTITNMIYESGNTFTTGFIDELKAALGIS